jgi:cyclopropane fatty-acyl-phospholipid synthase-like methyltransferase
MINSSSTDWFETWFDTAYYHTLYKHRDNVEAEKFIKNLLDYLKLPKGSKCLDLACGKGRHSLFLNKNGLNVTGLDLSANSIESAKSMENDTLKFDVHDMRKVYNTDEFHAIFNLFTSFGYFDTNEDNLKVLNSIHEMLDDKGVLVIDFMNAKKSISNLVESEEKEIDGIKFKLRRSFDGNHIHKNIQFKDSDREFNFNERVQALYKKDFERLLDKSGFMIENIFGDFNLNSFDESNSNRLIIIARKA